MFTEGKQLKDRLKDILIRTILLLLFVSMLFACYKYIQRINQLLTSEVTMHVREVAQKSSELTKQQFENVFSVLATISVNTENQDDPTTEFKTLLQKKAELHDFDMVGIVRKDGEVITSLEAPNDFKNPEFVSNFIQNEKKIALYAPSDEDATYFNMSAPILDGNEVVGAVFAMFRAESLVSKLDVALYDNQSQVYVLDAEGNIILDTKSGNIGKNIFSLDDFLQDEDATRKIKDQLGNNETGIEIFNVDDESRLNVYIPLQSNFTYSDMLSGWKYVVSVSEKTVFSYADEVMQRTVEALFVGLLSFSLIFVYTSYLGDKKRREIEEMETVDRLTGLGNAKYFYRKSLQEIMHHPNNQYAVVYFDINNFKILNDTFGYDYGNLTLQNIANILKDKLQNGEIYSKFPNDHYVFMLTVGKNGIDGIFAQILEMQEEILKYFKGNREITLSVGIYVLQPEETNIQRAVNKANMARTYVKRSSDKNIIVYDEKFYHNMKEESVLVEDIKEAIKSDGFQVYYQPKYCLQTGEMVGSEALLRWEHPVRSFISPAIFVPVAERNGLIVDVGRKVLEIVCRDLAEWHAANLNILPVSVNLSRVELYQQDVVKSILSLTEKYHIISKWLEFEITETVAMDHLSSVSSIIEELRKNGFQILLDDFGTGYSSLSCLKEIPIDTLKMDRAFLENFEADVKAQNVTKAIVYLAKSLGLKTIIEGVETKQQADMMKAFGCDYVQGYYFAKPMCKQDYMKFFT